MFVNSDNKCPACRGNVAEPNPDTQGLKPADFVDGEKLPSFCVVCSIPSENYIVVGEKNEVGGNDRAGVMARLLGAFAGVFAIEINPRPAVKEYKISVRVPVCEAHAKSKALVPLHVDYDKYRITLPVHADFLKKRSERAQ
ncbi:MAG: hypothetical protein QM760_23365 [Nibricoccus sp.]